MRAMQMTAPGEADVLVAAEIPRPELTRPSDVLVRVHAAGVNPIDAKVRKLNMYYPGRLPAILGCDGAGVVEAVGHSVTRFRAGDEVFFFNNGLGGEAGSYAEYTVVPEECLALKPKALSMVEAAGLPLVLITAWKALVDRGKLKPGENALIHAGGGGVGHMAIQLARHFGANVATTVSGPEKIALARSLGGERIIDYRREDFADATLEWTNGLGADLIMDTVGGEAFCDSFAAARLYGRIVSLLSTSCTVGHINIARQRNLSIGYVQMTTPLYFGLRKERAAQTRILEQGAELIEQGLLKVAVSRTLPLEEAAGAHRLIEAGHTLGKIVLRIA